MLPLGKVLALYGATGSGKTTQLGELAKYIYSETGKKTLLRSIDPGGYDSIEHLIGSIIDVDELGEANPWQWIQEKVMEAVDPSIYGLIANDSATGIGDILLKDAANMAARGVQVGQQKAFSLKVPGTQLVVGANNESQYGLIQTFLLDQIGKQSRVAKESGIDVVWTFADHIPDLSKGETPIIGPKLVGKALTAHLPRFIRYTLRLVRVSEGGPAIHRLLTQPQRDDAAGLDCLVNPRFPLGSGEELPMFIEPASVPEFWALVERAKEGAKASL